LREKALKMKYQEEKIDGIARKIQMLGIQRNASAARKAALIIFRQVKGTSRESGMTVRVVVYPVLV
jgi:hypothetical protein